MILTGADQVDFVEGPLYEATAIDEDGPFLRFDYYVIVRTVAGTIFQLNHGYRDRGAAEVKAAVVRARGALNLDHWSEIETMSLEEKFDLYAQHEWEVGHGYRAPHDLYHGIP